MISDVSGVGHRARRTLRSKALRDFSFSALSLDERLDGAFAEPEPASAGRERSRDFGEVPEAEPLFSGPSFTRGSVREPQTELAGKTFALEDPSPTESIGAAEPSATDLGESSGAEGAEDDLVGPEDIPGGGVLDIVHGGAQHEAVLSFRRQGCQSYFEHIM